MPRELVRRRASSFVLRVRGNSMIEEQIRDGDYVVVESRPEARDGETVVALIRGEEATLKKFYRRGALVRLEPANAALRADRAARAGRQIRGVVRGLLRRYCQAGHARRSLTATPRLASTKFAFDFEGLRRWYDSPARSSSRARCATARRSSRPRRTARSSAAARRSTATTTGSRSRCAGEPDPVTGMVIDLKDLQELLEREIMARFDHRDLNRDTAFFEKEPPTPENFARRDPAAAARRAAGGPARPHPAAAGRGPLGGLSIEPELA